MACQTVATWVASLGGQSSSAAQRRAPRVQLARARRDHLAPPPAATASQASSKFWCETVPSNRQADALKATTVTLAADVSGSTRPVTAFVAADTTSPTILVVARSLGCPFCQNLARGLVNEGVMTDLDAAGVPLYLASIGVPEKARAFCALTGFPPERLLADPGASVYEALDLERGFGPAFLSPTTPSAIGSEIAGGGGSALAASFWAWVPYLPPKPLEHALAQGGTFAFSGAVCVSARADRATADHLSPGKIREVGLGLVKG